MNNSHVYYVLVYSYITLHEMYTRMGIIDYVLVYATERICSKKWRPEVISESLELFFLISAVCMLAKIRQKLVVGTILE